MSTPIDSTYIVAIYWQLWVTPCLTMNQMTLGWCIAQTSFKLSSLQRTLLVLKYMMERVELWGCERLLSVWWEFTPSMGRDSLTCFLKSIRYRRGWVPEEVPASNSVGGSSWFRDVTFESSLKRKTGSTFQLVCRAIRCHFVRPHHFEWQTPFAWIFGWVGLVLENQIGIHTSKGANSIRHSRGGCTFQRIYPKFS